MKYEKGTAGSLMSADYITIKEEATVGETIEKLKKTTPRTELIVYVYVVDKRGILKGVVSLRDLFVSNDKDSLRSVMSADPLTIYPEKDQEEVARIMSRSSLSALPVVNKKKKLIGIVTFKDALRVLEEEATEDILKMAGAVGHGHREEERSIRLLEESVLKTVKVRMPWLFVALFGGLLAGWVISYFEEALVSIVALAFFIPVIMDMAGNVGTQSSTIFIRGLALGEVDKSDFFGHLTKELATGAILGLLIGLLVATFTYFWQGYLFALTVGISMFTSILFATGLGFIIPWTIYLFDMDPAAGASPLITTIKDIVSLIVYFGVASLLLGTLF